MTSFNDIFKGSFMQRTFEISYIDVFVCLALALLISMLIFWVYQNTYAGVMSSSSFGITLVMLTMITTMVILAVTANVVLSLGMVGALSIVRFRTAVKEPVEISFLFWAIAVGITLGAKMIPLAIMGTLIIAIFVLLFANTQSNRNTYILLVQCLEDAVEEAIQPIIKNQTKKSVVKAKTVSAAGIELTMEVRLCHNATDFLNQINAIEGVVTAALVSHSGEYM